MSIGLVSWSASRSRAQHNAHISIQCVQFSCSCSALLLLLQRCQCKDRVNVNIHILLLSQQQHQHQSEQSHIATNTLCASPRLTPINVGCCVVTVITVGFYHEEILSFLVSVFAPIGFEYRRVYINSLSVWLLFEVAATATRLSWCKTPFLAALPALEASEIENLRSSSFVGSFTTILTILKALLLKVDHVST